MNITEAMIEAAGQEIDRQEETKDVPLPATESIRRVLQAALAQQITNVADEDLAFLLTMYADRLGVHLERIVKERHDAGEVRSVHVGFTLLKNITEVLAKASTSIETLHNLLGVDRMTLATQLGEAIKQRGQMREMLQAAEAKLAATISANEPAFLRCAQIADAHAETWRGVNESRFNEALAIAASIRVTGAMPVAPEAG